MSFDLHLRACREACGLTQAEVCEVLHHSEGFLSKLETGKGSLKVPILVRLARIYTCHPFDFLTFHHFPVPRLVQEARCAVCGRLPTPSEEEA